MLPETSSAALAPGGTTHVASYSSTIAGPSAASRDRRGPDGRHDPAVALAEVDPARARDRARAPTDLDALGNARPVAQSLADDAQAHDLDRLVGARPVPVRALVLARERFLDRRARRHGHGQLERLSLVTAVSRARDANRRAGESLGGELTARLVLQASEGLGQLGGIEATCWPAPGPDVVVLDLGVEQTEGREEPGAGRHDDARHLQRPGHAGGEKRAVAAEGEERVLARVTTSLARDRTDRTHHVRRRDQMRAVRRLGERQAERRGDPLLEDLVGARRVEFHGAAGQRRRVQVAEDDVGVRDSRLGAAEVVAERPRGRAGAAWADLQRAAGVAPDDRAAAGADLGEVNGGNAQKIAASGEQSRTVHDSAADLVLGRPAYRAVLDDRCLGGGAAHVEGDQLVEPDPSSQRLGSDDTSGRPGLDDVHRHRGRRRIGHQPTVGLHDQQRSPHRDPIETGTQGGQVAANDRQYVRVDHRGRGALVFLDLR